AASRTARMSDNQRPVMVSPFLNFDPALINVNQGNEQQYIFAEGGQGRGRFERAFSAIGGCVLGGVSVGGARGLYSGLTDAQMNSLSSSTLRRSHLLNHMVRSGGSLAQTAGCIGLFYGIYDFTLSKARGDVDDNANTMAASVLTGLTYKLPGLLSGDRRAGLMGLARGGAAGLVVGASLVALTTGEGARRLLGGD
ncbi:hypothetical protein BOX15_Mlig004222g1, partial [Macrostomum lignano]